MRWNAILELLLATDLNGSHRRSEPIVFRGVSSSWRFARACGWPFHLSQTLVDLALSSRYV